MNAGRQSVAPERPRDIYGFELGKLLYKEGRYNDALVFFNKILELEADNAQVLYYAGCVYKNLNNWKLALAYLSRAVECGAEKAAACCALARTHLGMQKTQACLQACRDALEADPACAEAWAVEALGHIGQLRYEAALDAVEKGLALGRSPEALAIKGFIALQRNNLEESEALFQEAVEHGPRIAEIYAYRAQLYMRQKKFQDAGNDLQTGIKINPWCDILYGVSAKMYERNNNFAMAKRCYEIALWMNPLNAKMHAGFGQYYQKMNLPHKALAHFRQAQRLQPEVHAYSLELAKLYAMLDDEANAEKWFEKTLSLNHDDIQTLYNFALYCLKIEDTDRAMAAIDAILKMDGAHGMAKKLKSEIHVTLGQEKEALEALDSAMADDASNVELYYNYAVLSKSRAGKHLEKLKSWADDEKASAKDLMYAHFALAKAYEGLEEFDVSFGHYVRGNEYRAACLGQHFQFRSYEDRFNLLKARFGAAFFQDAGDAGDGADRAPVIFIVGMPRSGSTLVEQLLAAGKNIRGRGEKDTLATLESRFLVNRPLESFSGVDEESRNRLKVLRGLAAQLYGVKDGCACVVDKRLLNYADLWFAKLLYPKAKIIHTVRRPAPTCFSCFTNNFTHGHDYKNRLSDLSAYYVLYADLMAHWNAVFKDDILTVRYEELVQDPVRVSREMYAHIGQPWDEACLDFYKSKRVVKTASALQVRKSIYTTSVEYWKNFEEGMRPVVAYFQEHLPGFEL